jgi:hypothetical protein
MLRIVVIVAIRNKWYMSFKLTKFNICVIGMLIGIGLIGVLPVMHGFGLLVVTRLF